jgi:Nucleotidyl transferase AbiEii toxin, Type IV TA system
MLFVTWVGDPFRPTRDLDLLGYGDSEADGIAETFRAICSQPVGDDGVTFDVVALLTVPIYEEAEYGGVRVRTTATIAGARIPIQVDVGFGGAVSPRLSRSTTPPCWMHPHRIFELTPRSGSGREVRGTSDARHCQYSAQGFPRSMLIAKTFDLDRSLLTTAVHNTFY